jgi:hypothetical protein
MQDFTGAEQNQLRAFLHRMIAALAHQPATPQERSE